MSAQIIALGAVRAHREFMGILDAFVLDLERHARAIEILADAAELHRREVDRLLDWPIIRPHETPPLGAPPGQRSGQSPAGTERLK